MKLSIIIPTLNEEKYLSQTISAIRRQNFSDYEVIVSDGNSEDKTAEIAKNFGAIVVKSEKRHPSIQRNIGAAAARGEILFFLDADTVLPDGFLNDVLQEFIDRNLTIAGFYLDFGKEKVIRFVYRFGFNIFAYLRQFCKPVSAGAGIIAKKWVHEAISGFDETLVVVEDYDYCERASKVGKFGIIKSRKLPFALRRIEKEGDFQMLYKYLIMGTHVIFGKPIRKKIVKYDFGKY